MDRRTVLRFGGIALAGLVAGCSGGGGGGESPSTATGTATATPTATATATATPTATEATTPSVPTHELGERFTVGEGSNAIGYTFESFYRADAIGDSINAEEANGTFLIAVLTLHNPQETSTSLPVDDVIVRGEGTIRKVDKDGTEAIGSDSRINVSPIGYSSVTAGGDRTGAIAFDLPPNKSYRIEITPPGVDDATPHVVPIGDLGSIEELDRAVVG